MKLLVILGSTSTGKTEVALQLAHKFHGELVSVDSRQVYRGLDIGTGKLPGKEVLVRKGNGLWEMDGIKVWMYDVADPKKQYTVADYVKDAEKVILDIQGRGKLPILVGGTGFYLKALIEGLPSLAIPMDPKLRKELEKLSLGKLQKKLQEIAPLKWGNMNNSDSQNPRRLVRTIELVLTSSTSDGGSKGLLRGDFSKDDILKIGLTAPREVLYKRIDEWVVSRMEQGMVDEARKLHQDGLTFRRMRQLGLEYGILADYLEGKIIAEKKLVQVLQGKIHGYARRQLTWFKKEKNIVWFSIIAKKYFVRIENIVRKWYDSGVYAAKD